ncbi:ABC transporter substrate-binding protein [Paenibacillus sp. RRE4]|uniref:ABC transporter substrate-binding protein n=1 Tax=Paenibacillus sp. RRE4 TaxID=2962587 RepID=UPI002881D4F6|nr:ABC transporter substrate-binding protein [Paenibacillus sp. RRE4]MDT0122621.1 ABC transporter substrate-binding protein [Paenibacillus sp. RRE4]
MKLHQQYLLLHSQLGEALEHTITLADLAVILDCTHRNTLTIVKKMASLGWIHWHAQRGRGRRSTLSLLAPADQIATEYMMKAMNRLELQEAADQVRAFSNSMSMQHVLNQWLLGYSGHHTEAGTNNEQIDTLRLPVRQQLHALDPLYINLLAESFVTSHVYDGLVQRDERGHILPCLAHTWDVSDDRHTWIFHLRKGVYFHNGSPFTASNVVYSFERLLSTERRTLYREVMKQIHSVEVLNPLTVRFCLKRPQELFLSFLTTSRAVIVARNLDTDQANIPTDPTQSMLKPVGTGPFKVTVWDQNLCRLEAYAAYFQGRALIDRVDILQIPWGTPLDELDSDQKPASIENVESPFFHLVHNPTKTTGTAWTQASSGVTVTKLLTCNTQKTGPLNDPAVRAYLQQSIHLAQQKGTPNRSQHHEYKHENNPTSQESPFYDEPIALHLATIPQYRPDAERLALILEGSGFHCTIHTGNMEQFKGDWRLESDLILFSLIQDRDVELRRYDLFSTISEHLESSSQEQVQHRLQSIAASPHTSERKQALFDIEEFLIREHLMFILSQKPVETAYLPSVRGMSFNSQGWVNLRHIWFPSEKL